MTSGKQSYEPAGCNDKYLNVRSRCEHSDLNNKHKEVVKMINQMAKSIYEDQEKKGTWKDVDFQLYFALIIKNIGDAIACRRIPKLSNYQEYENNLSTFTSAFEDNINGTYQDKLADVYILILAFCGRFEIDVEDRDEIHNYTSDTVEVYQLVNQLTKYVSSMATREECFIVKSTFLSIEVVRSLIALETLCEMSGMNIHWHVGNKLAYNASIESRNG